MIGEQKEELEQNLLKLEMVEKNALAVRMKQVHVVNNNVQVYSNKIHYDFYTMCGMKDLMLKQPSLWKQFKQNIG